MRFGRGLGPDAVAGAVAGEAAGALLFAGDFDVRADEDTALDADELDLAANVGLVGAFGVAAADLVRARGADGFTQEL